MAWAKLVVPVGQHQQGAGLADAAAGVLQQIQRGFVCPVQILKNRNGCARSQLAQKGGVNGRALAVRIQQVGQAAPYLLRHILQRTERARREELVAPAPENPVAVVVAADKKLDQRRFSDAGFPADQRDAPARRAGFSQRSVQGSKIRLTLQDFHANMILSVINLRVNPFHARA